MKKFASFWNELLLELRKPKKIKNWTAKKEYFGEDFTAQAISNHTTGGTVECITLKGTKMNASLEDFQMVYNNWEGYISGRIQRKEFAKRSFVVKYVISIIHQFLK